MDTESVQQLFHVANAILSVFHAVSFKLILLVVGTIVACFRGWGFAPIALWALSLAPAVYAKLDPTVLDLTGSIWSFALISGTLGFIHYIALGFMVVFPREDRRQSSFPLVAFAAVLGALPLAFVVVSGGFESLPKLKLAVKSDREQTALPERLIGRWEGKAEIDAEALDRALSKGQIPAENRGQLRELFEQAVYSIEFRPDGSSTTVIEGLRVVGNQAVLRVKSPIVRSGTWAVLDESDHALKLESRESAAVMTATFMGDDTLLFQNVAGPATAPFLDAESATTAITRRYRLSRKRGLW